MNDRPYLTPAELTLALQTFSDATGKTKCPICGNETWEIEVEYGPDVAPTEYRPMPGVIGFRPTVASTLAPVIPCLILVCEECGFVRHHSIPMLLKKAANKK